jgi:hypothetical protein
VVPEGQQLLQVLLPLQHQHQQVSLAPLLPTAAAAAAAAAAPDGSSLHGCCCLLLLLPLQMKQTKCGA